MTSQVEKIEREMLILGQLIKAGQMLPNIFCVQLEMLDHAASNQRTRPPRRALADAYLELARPRTRNKRTVYLHAGC
ncbi:hypothetical protein RWA02_32325 (plasmid) [Sinorhizobium meliloti]|uniref:hypothetical protein n=1 Tax=Rhizobium meliloti TaxID=382 RepID=UPI00299E4289|nr:hypothetical protein [Sinorhizobium meliloti]MDW9998163.1 hypothetical protein [Sinorhizobium meliloti]